MPQFDWDKSIEDLCSSEKEAQELQEIASLLCGMPKAQSSPLFRDNLKERLMEKIRDEENADGNTKLVDFKALLSRKHSLRRPAFSAAAAVLLIVAVTFLYNQGMFINKSEIANPTDQPPSKTYVSFNEWPSGEEQLPEDGKTDIPLVDRENNDYAPKGEPDGEIQESNEGISIPGGLAPETETSETLQGPEATDPAEPLQEGEDPLKEEPEFEAWKNEKVLALGGKVKPESVYYNVRKEDNPEQVENTRCFWNPRKFVSAAESSEGAMGSKAWAEEILLNEGFMVKEGDYLEIVQQETQKGAYAEIIYKKQKGDKQNPALILHCGEKEGIISYYYEEQGGYAQPGFYRLLSPAQAFERVKELRWHTPQQRASFSFQEVSLTYHEFEVEANGRQKTVTLPAYCYLGMDTLSNGDSFQVYVPAL
jgi:hypothetical protein